MSELTFKPVDIDRLLGISQVNQRQRRRSGFFDLGERSAGGHWLYSKNDVLSLAIAEQFVPFVDRLPEAERIGKMLSIPVEKFLDADRKISFKRICGGRFVGMGRGCVMPYCSDHAGSFHKASSEEIILVFDLKMIIRKIPKKTMAALGYF